MYGPANVNVVVKNAKQTSGANAAQTLTVAAIANEYHVLDAIHVSFDRAISTPGKLLIVSFGANSVFETDISIFGQWPILLPGGLYNGTFNTAMTVTIPAGGTANTLSRLFILYR